MSHVGVFIGFSISWFQCDMFSSTLVFFYSDEKKAHLEFQDLEEKRGNICVMYHVDRNVWGESAYSIESSY